MLGHVARVRGRVRPGVRSLDLLGVLLRSHARATRITCRSASTASSAPRRRPNSSRLRSTVSVAYEHGLEDEQGPWAARAEQAVAVDEGHRLSHSGCRFRAPGGARLEHAPGRQLERGRAAELRRVDPRVDGRSAAAHRPPPSRDHSAGRARSTRGRRPGPQ